MKETTWKSKLVWLSIAAMVFSSAAGMSAAGAASDKAKEKSQTNVEVKAKVEAKAEAKTNNSTVVKTDDNGDDDTTVTGDVYANGKTHGLLNAIKNLQGKPAYEKVKVLLEARGVSAEELALVLEQQNDIEAAVVAQETAVATAPSDVDAVKKLAKLLNKAGKKGVKAFVNGKQPKFDVQPFIKDGRTLVPFRAMAASLKADVSYDAATKTVTVVRGDITVKLTLGSDVALVNGEEVKLDVNAQTVKSRTVIPLRFLSEELGAKVTFDQETQSIIVTE